MTFQVTHISPAQVHLREAYSCQAGELLCKQPINFQTRESEVQPGKILRIEPAGRNSEMKYKPENYEDIRIDCN